MKWLDKKHLSLLLVVILLAQRIYYFFSLSVFDASFGSIRELYKDTLAHHFWPFLQYYHIKPVGLLLRDKILLEVFGASSLATSIQVTTALCGVLSVWLLFRAAEKVSIQPVVAFAGCLLWGTALNVFDFWRTGSHYDHANVVAMSYLIFALASVLSQRSGYVHLAVSLALLQLFYSPALIYMPLLLVFFALVEGRRAWLNRRLWVALAIPVLVSGLQIAKNYRESNIAAPSSLAGTTRLQFSYFVLGSVEKLTQFIAQRPYPSWWKQCYEKGKDYHSFVGPIYGVCFWDIENTQNFRFAELLEDPTFAREPLIKSTLEKDLQNIQERPWLVRATLVPESSSLFSVAYSKVSARVWKDVLWAHPLRFLTQMRKTFLSRFQKDGARFFYGRLYEPPKMPVKSSAFVASAMEGFLWLSFVATLALVLWTPLLWWRCWRARGAVQSSSAHRLCLATALLFTITGLALSILICCENDRMYISLAPLSLSVGLFVISYVVSWIFERWFQSKKKLREEL